MRAGVLQGVALVVLAFAGCGGDDGPAGPSGPGEDAGAPLADAGPASCATEEGVRALVFAPSCAGSACHDASRPRAGLDLVTPGLSERIQGVRSVHAACEDQLLVVPGDAPASFFMEKLLGTHDTSCGDPMPNRGELTPEQVRCVAEWIGSL
ncbi:MAG TPA: hypothetical protein RMH85_06250 [Polyangiaceae bacterium LLY-WYZ-15_(1-7)]|nr:hypothetical protein [Sandaracinus sp.]HJL00176.1 hypothetical protein [Polyangiaceae bacterium LLY-WYZ-15_(1-7)]HJL08077.1 hypothetical protein [Polyangiaceae bacterium LLY-WYZ-15_(1-7)]HJL39404.1 hypothetical protein [Polyangiaceae bacterium LLY-WYZ-15_(1-7)]